MFGRKVLTALLFSATMALPCAATDRKEADAVPPPEECKSLPDGAWMDFQDSEFSLAQTSAFAPEVGEGKLAQLADDEQASDGKAARMPGDHGEWAVKCPMSDDMKGLWQCRVVARIDSKTDEGTGLTMGIFDERSKTLLSWKSVPVKSVSGNAYQTFDVGTLEMHGGMYVWVAPPKRPGEVTAVFVDRIYLVRPVAGGITVLTYNTHLFKGSSADVVGQRAEEAGEDIKRYSFEVDALKKLFTGQHVDFLDSEGVIGLFTGEHYKAHDAPIVFDDDNREGLIAQRLIASGADIVALQEVWAYERQKQLREKLIDVYPYSFCAPRGAGRSLTLEGKPKEDVKDGVRQAGKTSSGLLLLSKYNLKDAEFYPFPDKRTEKEEDQWATKGVITATVEPWPGGPTFRLGITHACTDMGGKDLPDISDLAAKTIGSHQGPAILLGDFNVHQIDPDPAFEGEYDTMRAIFENVGARDAYLQVHGTLDENGYTINLERNLLDQVFSPDKPVKGQADRLDYVFVKESGAGLTLTPEKAEVIKDWKYPVQAGAWHDVWAGKWASNYVAVRAFQLGGRAYLFGLKGTNRAYISEVKADGRGWQDIYEGEWSSNYVGTAITTFYLNGHPYIFALKHPALGRAGNQGVISRINDDGVGWKDVHAGKWDASYVAVVSFQLNGQAYLFGLKQNNRAYISRIKDGGAGWDDVYEGKWSSNYVGTAITTFYLDGRPYIFALKNTNQGVISRINDGGIGSTDVYAGTWDASYVAVVSFQLNGHPYLFGLKQNNRAYVSRIKDGGAGWDDVYEGEWSSNYVGTAITTFYLDDRPYLFALKGQPHNQGWITRLQEPGTISMDLSDHYPLQVKFKVVKE